MLGGSVLHSGVSSWIELQPFLLKASSDTHMSLVIVELVILFTDSEAPSYPFAGQAGGVWKAGRFWVKYSNSSPVRTSAGRIRACIVRVGSRGEEPVSES